ncbi:NECAP-like protein CG9132 [Macrosteles quadrilineatus]|uniref:NECAP-like protein CG9132 n=1 Tax=Macrosteles quadrilineatus TaxID=74068 RepID=UPI0023E0A8B4|nr:NECAP-like protein CG9132 [Macrosteles quadrilineatus]XP_054288366.1 NECAP-like protein CG9132 [Macrosteles quadrilineatus]
MDAYESVLLVKNEVFVFKLPPRATNRAYRAADWNLAEPQWTGRMRLVTKGTDCILKLEDKTSGELFAKCPIDKYPGLAVEAVSDSSRYFVLRIVDDNNGRTAFIGVGFSDRSDSFDLNVALQDHFKWVKKEEEIEKEKETPKPELDLRFKEGETIKINMKITKKDGSEVSSKPKTRPTSAGILPPPPGGVKIAPPPAPSVNSSPCHQPASAKPESWGEFASAGNSTSAAPVTPSNPSWVQF